MKQLSFLLLVVCSLAINAQSFVFKDVETNKIITDYYIELASNSKKQLFFPDNSGRVLIEAAAIKNATTIFISYNFQKLQLVQEDFKSKVIKLKVQNQLDEVTIVATQAERQRDLCGPFMSRFVPYSDVNRANVAIDISKVQGKKITAIIVEMKGASPFVPHGKGSKFTVQMYHMDSTLTKPMEIFETPFELTVNSRRSYDVKIDVSDLNVFVPDSTYLVIAVRALSGRLALRSAKAEKNPGSYSVHPFSRYDMGIFFKIYDSDSIPRMYFEYEL